MGVELSHQDGGDAEGKAETGLHTCILRRQEQEKPGRSEREAFFISKHISPLIEWPPNYYHRQTKMLESG